MATRRHVRRGTNDSSDVNLSPEYCQEMEESSSVEETNVVDEPLLVELNGNQEEELPNAPPPNESPEESYQATVVKIQRYAAIISHLLAVSQVSAVYWWIAKFLGGLPSSWHAGNAKQVFNWHPLLMVTAFCFMTISSLSFKSPWKHSNRNINKLVHASGWCVAALSAVIGLLAVFYSHNHGPSGYIANMYSLHSWIGAVVMALYVVQFVLGVRALGGTWLANARWSAAWKRFICQVHVVLGPLIYCLTGVTILLGIQEKEGFIGCAYHVDAPDYFPIQHVGRIPSTCLVSHWLGLLVFCTLVCTTIALADTRRYYA